MLKSKLKLSQSKRDMFKLKMKFKFELSQSKRCLKRDKYCVVEGQSLIRLNLI